MIKKSVIKLRQSEMMLYDLLLSEERPLSAKEVISTLYDAPYDIRAVIWSLVEKGKIEWTPERRLQIKEMAE